eukprot:1701883-Rhodomonas_salina.2
MPATPTAASDLGETTVRSVSIRSCASRQRQRSSPGREAVDRRRRADDRVHAGTPLVSAELDAAVHRELTPHHCQLLLLRCRHLQAWLLLEPCTDPAPTSAFPT